MGSMDLLVSISISCSKEDKQEGKKKAARQLLGYRRTQSTN